MSKRIVRIAAGKLLAQLPGLMKHEIHCVLNNGKTYVGVLVCFVGDHLTLEDARSHQHVLAIPELYEVIIDVNAIQVN